MPNAKLAFSIGLAACVSAIAMPALAAPERSPAQLAELLVRYDRIHEGAARDALAQRIDEVAGQRYATVSRLYWHTDLELAKAAAAKEHKPILALRMLGRLDQDLSCANSRLFRATLYADKEVSAYLRDNFVLYWSSEREVPLVTIDLGGGRKIETTTTGNSAHYVLAADGAVIDVLPGMYAPIAFRAELAKSLALATSVAKLSPERRDVVVREHHEKQVVALRERLTKVGAVDYLPGEDRLVGAEDVSTALLRAQRATVSKMYVEVPQLAAFMASDVGQLSDRDTKAWAALGLKLWPIRSVEAKPAKKGTWYGLWQPGPSPVVLDEQSRGLVTRLHGRVQDKELPANDVILRLEQHVVADSALDEVRLRPQIHKLIATLGTDFATINARIYADVFHTPATDEWLGLAPRTDFTGVPSDGITMTPRPAQR